MEKLISKIMSFRQTQVEKLKLNNNLTIGDVTTVNLTMLKVNFNIQVQFKHYSKEKKLKFNVFFCGQGGVEANVIPPQLSATFDFRLSLDVDLVDFENQIKKWIKDSGDGIEMKWIQKNSRINPTKVDESNLFWMKIKEQFDLM